MASKFLVLLFLVTHFSNSFACGLSEKIVSLSGPITMLLEEMDLLKENNLVAISSFHPVKNETNADVLMGGIFLSTKTLKSFDGATVFFDSSRDLEKVMKNQNLKNTVEVKTRGLSSTEAARLSIRLLEPRLKNCRTMLAEVKSKVKKLEEEISKAKKGKVVFFLGDITHKLPTHVMVNDGFVLDLIKAKKLSTYQSDLAYVVWSEKELKKYSDHHFIGIHEKKSDSIYSASHMSSENRYNYSYPGILTPGISQVNFMLEFLRLESFFNGKL